VGCQARTLPAVAEARELIALPPGQSWPEPGGRPPRGGRKDPTAAWRRPTSAGRHAP